MSSPRPETPEEPWGGHPQGPPPPPPPPEGYQPFQQYYQPVAPVRPNRQRNGIGGALISAALAVWTFIKFGGLFLLKFGAFKTLATMVISFGFYALFYGPVGAAGLVIMILLHEMGHVVEIRRQGMQATAPLFIPFFGAAIFQRSHPSDALHQAEIGIAGPVAGTLASIAALVLFGATGFKWLAFWAFIGFAINLFNMIPFGMLDGGWILAPVSKWIQVAGLAVLGYLFFTGVVSPIVIIIVVLGIPVVVQRFRNRAMDAYLTSEPAAQRYLMGAAWLGLVAYLAFFFVQTETLLGGFVR